MAYFSNVMIAVTKKDFETIKKEQMKIADNFLLEELDVEEYKENDIECVFAHFGYIRYEKNSKKFNYLKNV